MTRILLEENPAERASREALEALFGCIQQGRSFVFEAGAGAGKTYSLIKALRHLIGEREKTLKKNHQQIACITYTNVATEEILSRIDSNPAVFVSTIHAFCWNAIQAYQDSLRQMLLTRESWNERIAACFGGIQKQKVLYDLGHPSISEERIYLGHNDVVSLASELVGNERFRTIFTQRFPVLLIDEFQDTDKDFSASIINNFISQNRGPLIGFFGDHWQRIYPSGCGNIIHENLIRIGKRANFRSVSTIVNMLNAMRPELTQEVEAPTVLGELSVFHTNSWVGQRRTGAHWAGDLPSDVSRDHVGRLRAHLEGLGWNFSPEHTKILMLTHKVLAEEQGYRELVDVFDSNDEFSKKENPHMKYFVDFLEPVFESYITQKYGSLFSLLGKNTVAINAHGDKVLWSNNMQELERLRQTGTIGDVLSYLKNNSHPRLSKTLDDLEDEFNLLDANIDLATVTKPLKQLVGMRGISYSQVISLSKFINDKTPFATKHSVKGTEYENVLVILGRGWSQYNFNKLLEQYRNIPVNGQDRDFFERNRNLFYVACSRPKRRLALIFTQQLSVAALNTLTEWCGQENIHDFGQN